MRTNIIDNLLVKPDSIFVNTSIFYLFNICLVNDCNEVDIKKRY